MWSKRRVRYMLDTVHEERKKSESGHVVQAEQNKNSAQFARSIEFQKPRAPEVTLVPLRWDKDVPPVRARLVWGGGL
jgi:hypothetical protein